LKSEGGMGKSETMHSAASGLKCLRPGRRAERMAHSVLSKKNIGIWKVDILSEGVYFPTHNLQLTTRNVKLFESVTNGS
jgi:hypothetical protein